MPPRESKRKAQASGGAKRAAKKFRASESISPERVFSDPSPAPDLLRQPHPFHREAEENNIVLREFYPHEMSSDRARAYQTGKIQRPIDELNSVLEATAAERKKVEVKSAVVHWFKMDLRLADNRALYCASEKAKEAGVPLLALYIVSPQDFVAHLVAPIRVDFLLRTLKVLKDDLAKLDIPLHIETVRERKQIPGKIVERMEEWGASHLYANMEYEVDELRRETKLVRMLAHKGMAMEIMHDTCIVPPGQLSSGTGKQYAVYSPWYRAWGGHVHDNPKLLDPFGLPSRNPPTAREDFAELFKSEIPAAPPEKRLTKQAAKQYEALWPAGEHAAMERLEAFSDEKIAQYAARRNLPAESGTSSLSVFFASGALSARTAVHVARKRNGAKKQGEGLQTWISEVAWRDFYKHVLVNWPHVCMNKPFKLECSNISWSYDKSHFDAWCEGRTGFPIVDAAMRQLRETGWMHNRCRMIVASFLAKDLLIDWRMGERYFMEHLVDGDFASNSGGWGFSASVGVDPQPYFRIFNPLLQSEKFDADGEYIRRWVPELRNVSGKAVHEPYARGAAAEAARNKYPKPITEHKAARERALAAYKKGADSHM